MEAWPSCHSEYPRLASAHGAQSVKVIVEGGRYRGEATTEVQMGVAEYSAALHNGTLPESAYVFTDVQGELRCDELFRTVPRNYATRGRLMQAAPPLSNRLRGLP